MAVRDPLEIRRKYIEGWNKTMVRIWKDSIRFYDVRDTGRLLESPVALQLHTDGRIARIHFTHQFLEYGIWQNYGVGRELKHGDFEHNSSYIEEHGRKRERRPWFSFKYYSSVMNLRDFMGLNLADQFRSLFADALDIDNLRNRSSFYKRKGY